MRVDRCVGAIVTRQLIIVKAKPHHLAELSELARNIPYCLSFPRFDKDIDKPRKVHISMR